MIEFRWLFSSLPMKKLTKQRSGYFGSIFFHFKALIWAPRVIDWWCTTHRGWQCKTYKKNLTGDRYQMTVCLSTISQLVLLLPPLRPTLIHYNFLMIQARKLWLVPISCKLFAVPAGLNFYFMLTILGKMQASKTNIQRKKNFKTSKYTLKTSF